jgi:hypothetical protein
MGSKAMSGFAKIWNTKPMAMKVMATPASAESMAARGVWRRTQSPKKAHTVSMMPLSRHANRPTCQVSVGFFVAWYTGPMMRKMKASRLTVLMP